MGQMEILIMEWYALCNTVHIIDIIVLGYDNKIFMHEVTDNINSLSENQRWRKWFDLIWFEDVYDLIWFDLRKFQNWNDLIWFDLDIMGKWFDLIWFEENDLVPTSVSHVINVNCKIGFCKIGFCTEWEIKLYTM